MHFYQYPPCLPYSSYLTPLIMALLTSLLPIASTDRPSDTPTDRPTVRPTYRPTYRLVCLPDQSLGKSCAPVLWRRRSRATPSATSGGCRTSVSSRSPSPLPPPPPPPPPQTLPSPGPPPHRRPRLPRLLLLAVELGVAVAAGAGSKQGSSGSRIRRTCASCTTTGASCWPRTPPASRSSRTTRGPSPPTTHTAPSEAAGLAPCSSRN